MTEEYRRGRRIESLRTQNGLSQNKAILSIYKKKNRLLKPYQIKDLAVFIFYFFLAFPKVFGRVLGEKIHPKKSGVTCKIKKVPQRGTFIITYIFGYFTITFNCS